MGGPQGRWDHFATTMVGQTIGGRYMITELISLGGMGAVYNAVQLGLDRKVALKMLRPELRDDPTALARFQREASVAAQLNHPNVVAIIDFGLDPSSPPFLVMEFIPGEPLQSIMKATGPLPIDRALGIVRQVLLGLSAAHSAGLTHRDLKPPNIMVSSVQGVGEVVKIVDFGIAKPSTQLAKQLTLDGQVLGTPAYMAPEQLQGEQIDRRADLWATGVVLYSLLTGRRPFGSSTDSEFVNRVLSESPTPLDEIRPDCPHWLSRAVETALAKRANDRYASADEFLAALGLGSTTGESASAVASQPLPRSRPRRGLWAFAIVAFAVAVLAAGGVVAMVLLNQRDAPSVSQAGPHNVPPVTPVQLPGPTILPMVPSTETSADSPGPSDPSASPEPEPPADPQPPVDGNSGPDIAVESDPPPSPMRVEREAEARSPMRDAVACGTCDIHFHSCLRRGDPTGLCMDTYRSCRRRCGDPAGRGAVASCRGYCHRRLADCTRATTDPQARLACTSRLRDCNQGCD